MSNMRGEKPEISATDDHKEQELLLSLWQAQASAYSPLPVSSKTKAALQELLRSHGVTHMPAIDAMEVYDAPEIRIATPVADTGRAKLFELMGAMREGAALAARSVKDFLDAMLAPLPAPAGSALRLSPFQLDVEPALASSQGAALGWHIATLSFRPSDRQVTMVIQSHLHAPSPEPLHLAILGWSAEVVTQLRRPEASDEAWVPMPQDLVRLWEGDLPGDQDAHRIAFKLPEGCVWDATFDGLRTLLVEDGAGALVASLKLGPVAG